MRVEQFPIQNQRFIKPRTFFFLHIKGYFCMPICWRAKVLITHSNSGIQNAELQWLRARTTDTQWRHKSKISETLGRCGRQNMLRPYLKIWEWEWIFGRAVKAISSLGVRSPCLRFFNDTYMLDMDYGGNSLHCMAENSIPMPNF